MIKKFDEEFPDLIVFDDQPKRASICTDTDTEASFPEQEFDEVELFLLSQNVDGFIVKFCTREKHRNEITKLKNVLEENNSLLENVINVLNNCLPISYEEFSGMGYCAQAYLVRQARINMSEEDRKAFNQVFRDLLVKSKTMTLSSKSGEKHED